MLARMVSAPLDLRRSSLANRSVAGAFALSLLLHAALFLTIELGYQTGWWNASLLFSRRARIDDQMARLLEAARKQQQAPEVPLMFVDVDPSQAAQEPPKDAKYYSALNSRAANPDPRLDSGTPKIEGRQERVPQTMDRSRPEAQPLQPAPKPPPQVAEVKPEPEPEPEPPKPEPPKEPKPQPAVKPGDLAYAKPPEKPKESSEPKPAEPVTPSVVRPPRARTLEAARRAKGMMAGEKTRQQGGVKRFAMEATLDVRATPFGSYDAAIIAAIQKHWYDLLDARAVPGSYSGKVVLEFRLNSDGSVTDMKVSESSVTDTLALLCQRAVQDPAPFAKWPPDLRRLVGREYREVRFTFYYN